MKDAIIIGKRYEVISKVGAGGMADVYKGRDTMLNRYVAIKVLKKEFREDSNFVKKFRSEAQAAAGLMNPNIVNVYDVGEDRGLYYMVMELVEGITLKEYINKKGRLSAKEVISIAIQMCNGIRAAHEQGIIHRDIKPHNVIISKDGKVKVTDFGIAKATSSTTTTTSAMGSVHYTSPEQARGGYVDAKSDIYSIGVTLYEMVTGRVPFDGETAVEVAVKHLQNEITPPSEYVPDIPYSLEQIILKCTQKNTESRYASCADLVLDLKHSLVDPDGDFVDIGSRRNDETMIFTEETLNEINSIDDEYEDEYEDEGDEESGDSDEVNPRMNKVMKVLTAVVVVLIMIIALVVIGNATGILKIGSGITALDTSDRVSVPNVVGKTEGEAITILESAGLKCKVSERKESKKYEEGYVIESNPEEGKKVKKGTEVEIVVSSGLTTDEIEVPDVSGMDEEAAQKALESAGFTKISSEAVYDDTVEQGTVIETNPKSGEKVTKDTKITMKVSKGSEKKEVPNVVGKSENEAKSILTSAGFTVSSVETDYSESVQEGCVISQSPTSGKKEKEGTSVSLVVSLGAKPQEKITVPSVIGVGESSAKQMILNAGLNVDDSTTYTSSETVAAGCVIACSPGVGTQLTKGSSVSLVISTGPSAPQDEEEEY